MKEISVILLCITLTVFNSTAQNNIIPNPGFEKGDYINEWRR